MKRTLRFAVVFVACFLSSLAFADLTKQQALSAVLTFVARAARGAEQTPSLAAVDTNSYVENVSPAIANPGSWHIAMSNGVVSIRKTDGKIRGFVMDPERHPELEETYPLRTPLSTDQLKALADEYLALAGYPDTYVVVESEMVFPAPLEEARYRLELRPVRGQAVVLGMCLLELEPTTGFLRWLAVDDPAAAPSNLTPNVPLEAVHPILAAYASEAKGFQSCYEQVPPVLAVWAPEDQGAGQYSVLTSEQLQMGAAKQGMLVYYACVGETASYSARLGFSRRRFSAWVDAMTGVILATCYADEWMLLGASTKPSKLRRGPLAWDWSPGPTVVYVGRRWADAKKGDVVSASAPAKTPEGKPIILRRARLSVPCRFDPASGLLWRMEKKRRVYGKPNAALLKAIKKVLAAR